MPCKLFSLHAAALGGGATDRPINQSRFGESARLFGVGHFRGPTTNVQGASMNGAAVLIAQTAPASTSSNSPALLSSTHTGSFNMTDPQLQSGFFRLPIELRDEIYRRLDLPAFHLCRQGQRIVLSTCKTPNPSHEDDGSERHRSVYPSLNPADYLRFSNSADYLVSKPEWARRLRSTWGPHWACEESLADEGAGVASRMLVCKRMYVNTANHGR